MSVDYDNPKPSFISKMTLFLPKEKGGINLIDFQTKMKAFRILLVFKYINCREKTWSGILNYWFAVNTYSITRERWDNSYPHVQDIEDIPPYFRKCLTEFKYYCSKHGYNVNETITSKIIYEKLMSERNHTPTAIMRYSEMGVLLKKLPNYSFLDPYLRQFLYKLYHCKLIFKRYRLNINYMLNLNQKCILCNNAIDTPKHLFEYCEKGRNLRGKRDYLITFYNHNNIYLTENKKIYSYFNKSYEENKIIQYIITASNYSIYREKIKKFYDRTYIVNNEAATYSFINRLKLRIFYDHRRLKINKFKEIWDTNESQLLFSYNEDSITNWNF